MTRGKLLDNDPTLFRFISILMMTQGTRKQTTEPVPGTPILGMAILGTNKLQPLLQLATPSHLTYGYNVSANIPGFVSLDLR